MNGMMKAMEAGKQGSKVRKDTGSGSMFADNILELLETPEELQKRIEKALEYTRKWRVTANFKKRAVVVYQSH